MFVVLTNIIAKFHTFLPAEERKQIMICYTQTFLTQPQIHSICS